MVDTGRCIGCKRLGCCSACKRWNGLKVERDELITDRETDLTANNWLVVNLLIDTKNRDDKTYDHWACQHCIEPACAGVCPVKAITKMPEGPVVIDEKKCIGCRYCFQACPFKVPRFDFEKRVARKCHMCYNRIPLLDCTQPACAAACPVGALSFGYRHEMILEAERRALERGGATYIMGLTEAGGTDMITILPTKPQDLSMGSSAKEKGGQSEPGQDQDQRLRNFGGLSGQPGPCTSTRKRRGIAMGRAVNRKRARIRMGDLQRLYKR